MSKFMYLATKKKLLNDDFDSTDIFDIPTGYEDDFWFLCGVKFDKEIDSHEKRLLTAIKSPYIYNIKSAIFPLNVETRIKNDMPDLYEASVQLTKWFIKFCTQEMENGNEIRIVSIWMGNEEPEIFKKSTLKLSDVNLYECPPTDLWTAIKIIQ